MRRRRVLVTAIAALAAAASAGAATAAAPGPPVRILSLRVLVGDGPVIAKGTLDRRKRYSYRVVYTLGGAQVARVTRAATVEGPEGVVAIVRPPAGFTDPGTYRVTARIRVGPDDPSGLYTLRYTIVARVPGGGTTRRSKEILLRFAPRAAVAAPLGAGH